MNCIWCDNKSIFVDEDLPVGPRAFCSEKCWSIYNGMPIEEEGHYGFVKRNE